MAVDTNALRLSDYALMSNNPRVQSITYSLIDNGSVLARDIPFVTDPTMIQNGSRVEGGLPSISWTKLNEPGDVVKFAPTPFREQAYIMRNRIQADKFLLMDKNQITNPLALQVAGWSRAWSYDTNDKFINNNHTTGDADSIVGIRARLDDPTLYGTRSGNKIDAGATLTTAATAANVNVFLEKLDELLWSVQAPDGQGVVLYVNDKLYRRLHFALRLMGTTGGLRTDQDQFDRTITMYKGAQIRDIGYKADQATRIITSTETNAGVDGASTYTSIYAVHYGQEFFFGWQMAPLFVSRPVMLDEDGVVQQITIDWAGGLYQQHTWAIARLYGINLG